jgi:penicillin-binding protein 1C
VSRLGRIARALLLAAVAAGALLLILAQLVPLPARLAAPPSQVVELRDGQVAHVFLSPDEKWRFAARLERIDPAFVAALIALEDRRFHAHPGVDPLALARAAWSNVARGRRVSGASTITMQLARLLEPRPRTLRSKLIEMFRAVQLETRLGKRRILEAYLTFAPYGGNVEGVEAAALAYFGHGAAHLTPVEIATLLAVPQGPARLAPSAENRDRLAAHRDALVARLFPGAPASGPPPDRLTPLPRLAPHAAVWLAGRQPAASRIRAALDGGAQRIVEGIAARAAPELARRGIGAGAIVVVEHATREVVALVGNLDWDGDGGQIAMFARPRSPGSTLKPLLYALAIDRGLALPAHLVADVPAAYGGWRPRNFDADHAGLVTLREALSRSLNLPFVELLERFGVEPFLAELARLGVRSPRAAPGHYGLSLILGGIEATPLEIAGLYATLAEDGRHRRLRLTLDEPVGPALTAFSPGVAALTRESLALRDRPDFPKRRALRGVPAEIHWKTGTSFGFRDAWAVGSGPRYTAAVWLGNVDQRGSAELVGAEAAGPILFDVLEALAGPARAPRPPAAASPADLAPVEVCAFSGHLPTAACDERTTVLAPRTAVAPAPCPYHVRVDVDVATGEAVGPACRAGRVTESRAFVVLPSRVAGWLDERHRALPAPPRWAEGCAPPLGDRPPRILSPTDGQVVLLVPGLPADRQELPLSADTASPEVSWFVDGALVRTAPAREKVFVTPTPGPHEIVVVDAGGRKERIAIDVRVAR